MSELKGKKDEMVGKAKEVVGKVTGDEQVEGEGKADQVKGQAKEVVEEAKVKAGDAAKKIKGMFK